MDDPYETDEISGAPATRLLGAYAAKQCPYRLFREYDPTEPAVPAPPDDSLQQLFDDGIAFEAEIVREISALHPGDVVAIPGRDEADHDRRRALTDAALAAGTPIILGALMQPDLAGRRMAEIDLLVGTGRTTAHGKAEYRAVDVKSHRCTVNDPDEQTTDVHDLRLLGERVAVRGFAPKYREDDCLQLAHYHRVLQAHGLADADEPGVSVWGAIIGLERVVAWHDLTHPAFATLTPQERADADGDPSITFHRRHRSTKRTALDRYDFEFGFRLRVVDTAVRRTSQQEDPIVLPVSVAECARCPWNAPCHADLVAIDDVSLVSAVGYGGWRVHRFMGVETVHQLAELDPAEAAEMYADTPLTATALTSQIRCARAAVAGRPIVAPDWDETTIPHGDLEIDLDLENDEHVYLWGARLTEVPPHWPEERESYVHFSSFETLDARGEVQLATDVWNWLTSLRERAHAEGLTVRIYGYNAGPVEGAALRRLVPSDELEALFGSDEWVDLLPHMRRKFWSNEGHGLKVMALASGFAWRDDDPGGFASMQWHRNALAGIDRDANISRILAYNEDDCAATAALR